MAYLYPGTADYLIETLAYQVEAILLEADWHTCSLMDIYRYPPTNRLIDLVTRKYCLPTFPWPKFFQRYSYIFSVEPDNYNYENFQITFAGLYEQSDFDYEQVGYLQAESRCSSNATANGGDQQTWVKGHTKALAISPAASYQSTKKTGTPTSGGQQTTKQTVAAATNSQKNTKQTATATIGSQQTTKQTASATTGSQQTTKQTASATTKQTATATTGSQQMVKSTAVATTGSQQTTKQKASAATGIQQTTKQKASATTGSQQTTVQTGTDTTGSQKTTKQILSTTTGSQPTTEQVATATTGSQQTTKQTASATTKQTATATTGSQQMVKSTPVATTGSQQTTKQTATATKAQNTKPSATTTTGSQHPTKQTTAATITGSQQITKQTASATTNCQQTTKQTATATTNCQQTTKQTATATTNCQQTTKQTATAISSCQQTTKQSSGGDAHGPMVTQPTTGQQANSSRWFDTSDIEGSTKPPLKLPESQNPAADLVHRVKSQPEPFIESNQQLLKQHQLMQGIHQLSKNTACCTAQQQPEKGPNEQQVEKDNSQPLAGKGPNQSQAEEDKSQQAGKGTYQNQAEKDKSQQQPQKGATQQPKEKDKSQQLADISTNHQQAEKGKSQQLSVNQHKLEKEGCANFVKSDFSQSQKLQFKQSCVRGKKISKQVTPSIAPQTGNVKNPVVPSIAPQTGNAKKPVVPSIAPQTGNAKKLVVPSIAPQTGNAKNPVVPSIASQTGNAKKPVVPAIAPQTGNAKKPVVPSIAPQTGNAKNPVVPSIAPQTGNAKKPVVPSIAPQTGNAKNPVVPSIAPQTGNAKNPPSAGGQLAHGKTSTKVQPPPPAPPTTYYNWATGSCTPIVYATNAPSTNSQSGTRIVHASTEPAQVPSTGGHMASHTAVAGKSAVGIIAPAKLNVSTTTNNSLTGNVSNMTLASANDNHAGFNCIGKLERSKQESIADTSITTTLTCSKPKPSTCNMQGTVPSSNKTATTPSCNKQGNVSSNKTATITTGNTLGKVPLSNKTASTATSNKQGTGPTSNKTATTASCNKQGTGPSGNKTAITATCNKQGTGPTSNKTATTASCNKQGTGLSGNKTATTATCNKQGTGPTSNKTGTTATCNTKGNVPASTKAAATVTCNKQKSVPTSNKTAITATCNKQGTGPSGKKTATTATSNKHGNVSVCNRAAATATSRKQSNISTRNKTAATATCNKQNLSTHNEQISNLKPAASTSDIKVAITHNASASIVQGEDGNKLCHVSIENRDGATTDAKSRKLVIPTLYGPDNLELTGDWLIPGDHVTLQQVSDWETDTELHQKILRLTCQLTRRGPRAILHLTLHEPRMRTLLFLYESKHRKQLNWRSFAEANGRFIEVFVLPNGQHVRYRGFLREGEVCRAAVEALGSCKPPQMALHDLLRLPGIKSIVDEFRQNLGIFNWVEVFAEHQAMLQVISRRSGVLREVVVQLAEKGSAGTLAEQLFAKICEVAVRNRRVGKWLCLAQDSQVSELQKTMGKDFSLDMFFFTHLDEIAVATGIERDALRFAHYDHKHMKTEEWVHRIGRTCQVSTFSPSVVARCIMGKEAGSEVFQLISRIEEAEELAWNSAISEALLHEKSVKFKPSGWWQYLGGRLVGPVTISKTTQTADSDNIVSLRDFAVVTDKHFNAAAVQTDQLMQICQDAATSPVSPGVPVSTGTQVQTNTVNTGVQASYADNLVSRSTETVAVKSSTVSTGMKKGDFFVLRVTASTQTSRERANRSTQVTNSIGMKERGMQTINTAKSRGVQTQPTNHCAAKGVQVDSWLSKNVARFPQKAAMRQAGTQTDCDDQAMNSQREMRESRSLSCGKDIVKVAQKAQEAGFMVEDAPMMKVCDAGEGLQQKLLERQTANNNGATRNPNLASTQSQTVDPNLMTFLLKVNGSKQLQQRIESGDGDSLLPNRKVCNHELCRKIKGSSGSSVPAVLPVTPTKASPGDPSVNEGSRRILGNLGNTGTCVCIIEDIENYNGDSRSALKLATKYCMREGLPQPRICQQQILKKFHCTVVLLDGEVVAECIHRSKERSLTGALNRLFRHWTENQKVDYNNVA